MNGADAVTAIAHSAILGARVDTALQIVTAAAMSCRDNDVRMVLEDAVAKLKAAEDLILDPERLRSEISEAGA